MTLLRVVFSVSDTFEWNCVLIISIDLCFFLKEKMSGSSASNSTISITGALILRVVDAQTSVENGRKFTKYKVSVNYNGREWEIWRRYKEFNALNEKVGKCCLIERRHFHVYV